MTTCVVRVDAPWTKLKRLRNEIDIDWVAEILEEEIVVDVPSISSYDKFSFHISFLTHPDLISLKMSDILEPLVTRKAKTTGPKKEALSL